MNQKVHVTKNASEWLFDGYEDAMINLAKDNPLLDAGDIPFDRFGWFYMVSLKCINELNFSTIYFISYQFKAKRFECFTW
jgi:CD36 family